MRWTLNKTRFLAGKTDPENTSLWLSAADMDGRRRGKTDGHPIGCTRSNGAADHAHRAGAARAAAPETGRGRLRRSDRKHGQKSAEDRTAAAGKPAGQRGAAVPCAVPEAGPCGTMAAVRERL